MLEGRILTAGRRIETGSHGPRRRYDLSAIVMILAAATLLLLVVVPLFALFREAVTDRAGHLTAANLVQALARPRLRDAILNTILLSLCVAALSVIIAVPLAFGATRTNMPLKRTLRAVALISIISPGFLIALAYVLLLGPNSGVINQWLRWLLALEATHGPLNVYSAAGYVLLTVPTGVGLCFLQLVPAFGNLDPAMEEASRICGGGPLRTARAITLRLIRPALLSGFVLTFTLSLASYGTPQILGINVLSIAIRSSLLVTFNIKQAAVLSMIATVIALLAVMVYRWATQAQKRYETLGGRGQRHAQFELGSWRHVLTAMVIVYAILGCVLPYATLVASSLMKAQSAAFSWSNITLDNYTALVADAFTRRAILNSTVLSITAAVGVIVLGLAVGYILVRTRIPGRALLDYVAILPLGLAGTAFGIAILVTYLNPPFRFLGLPGTLTILWLAYVAHYVSFGVRGVQSALVQISTELSEAARIVGATRLRALVDIEVPLLRGAIISIGLLVVVLCFPELSMSIMLRSVNSQVAATALLERWDGQGGFPAASAMAVLMFGLVTAFLLAAQSGAVGRTHRLLRSWAVRRSAA